ncbi:MAG: cytochrome ubiquinol oxidase subunit I [Proteobacteria bacterium]|nr:cytochrome ubiquinol oxidase subunit I [Pseudomonadota bacterium]
MDPVLLARIQFAVTIGFHYIFPPLTLGVTLLIVVFLGLHLKTNDELYDRIARFWIGILVVIFSIGVATGIVMEFQFGTNWEKYSRFVGDIFGAPLAAEGIFAFFLESTFLGVLIFGRNRVSKKMYFFSALMVTLGSILSAFWIIVANSWQQTPTGYHIVNGRAELTSFFEAVFNPSTLPRFSHAVVGGWVAGSFFVAGLSGYYLLKKQHIDFAKKSLLISLVVAFLSSGLQIELGHLHAVQVTHTQPEKMAAFESMFETRRNAPMVILGIPNPEERRIDYEISIPSLLSIMIDLDPDFEVKGLNEFEEELWPPIMIPFFSYRIMVGLGFYFLLLALAGLYLYWKEKIIEAKPYLILLLLSIPLPIVANESGWIAAEVGRQPWIVYHELKTADAISTVVSAGEILFSLILFSCLYAAIFALFVFLLKKKIMKGPEAASEAY